MRQNALLIKRAARAKKLVFLTLGPDVRISFKALRRVPDVLLNEREAMGFLNYCRKKRRKKRVKQTLRVVPASKTSPKQFCRWLQRTFGCAVVVTLGENGAVGIDHEGIEHNEPALVVEVTDPVGAGDALAGFFATAIAEGLPFSEALRIGVVAGSLACTEEGAQRSIPTRKKVQEHLAEHTRRAKRILHGRA